MRYFLFFYRCGVTGGKWLIHAPADEIDEIWECVALTLAHHGFGQEVLKAKVTLKKVKK